VTRSWRTFVLGVLLGPLAAATVLLAFLAFRARWDIPYLLRVLVRQESGTEDYRWKRSAAIAPPAATTRWREERGCAPAAAALASGPTGMDPYLADGGALALVVVHDGAIACEWYGNGGERDRPAAAFSVSKVLTALLVSRAVAEGRITGLDDSIAAHVPELGARDRRFEGISLRDLVDMRSGIAFDEDARFPWVDQDAPAVYYASDLARTVVERPRIVAPPGGFAYNDYAPNLVGLALERAYGTRSTAAPMASLWSDLRAEFPAAWSVDDRGFAWHESGFVVTARDLARVGQLMLDAGRVGDRQVAPAAFLERTFEPSARRPVVTFAGTPLGYRNGWWILDDGALLAMGRHGQVMLVAPATRTVVVRMGRDGGAETNIAIAARLRRIAAAYDRPAAAPTARFGATHDPR
jgi:CubicO group peptidase (beta-lactamase class C family)